MSQPGPHPIERGDPAPDFWLPTASGKLGQFQERFNGNRMVLVFCPDPGAAETSHELKAFRDRAAEFHAQNCRLALVMPPQAEPVAFAGMGATEEETVFIDSKGAIFQGFGVASAANTGPVSLVIGPDQRVLAVLRDEPDQAEKALNLLSALVPIPGQLVETQAPVLLVPNVFPSALCDKLVGDWRRDHYEGEVVSGGSLEGVRDQMVVDRDRKIRTDHKPDQATNQQLYGLVGRRIVPEVYKAFQFETAYLQPFVIGSYLAAKGGFFRAHRDNTTERTKNRRFAITINLNEGYEGGCLRFPEFGQQLYRPPLGGAVVFSCSLLHEATPVTAGERFVALTFMLGKRDLPDQDRR